jgi:hypothetical protein
MSDKDVHKGTVKPEGQIVAPLIKRPIADKKQKGTQPPKAAFGRGAKRK